VSGHRHPRRLQRPRVLLDRVGPARQTQLEAVAVEREVGDPGSEVRVPEGERGVPLAERHVAGVRDRMGDADAEAAVAAQDSRHLGNRLRHPGDVDQRAVGDHGGGERVRERQAPGVAPHEAAVGLGDRGVADQRGGQLDTEDAMTLRRQVTAHPALAAAHLHGPARGGRDDLLEEERRVGGIGVVFDHSEPELRDRLEVARAALADAVGQG
jgi:hypothetical protein